MSVTVQLRNRLAGAPLPRAVTEPLISWAMLKECLDELWILDTDKSYQSTEDVDLGLIALLKGWDRTDGDAYKCVAEKWVEVAVRWRREVAGLTTSSIGLRTIYPGDRRGLAELRYHGARLFVAV